MFTPEMRIKDTDMGSDNMGKRNGLCRYLLALSEQEVVQLRALIIILIFLFIF